MESYYIEDKFTDLSFNAAMAHTCGTTPLNNRRTGRNRGMQGRGAVHPWPQIINFLYIPYALIVERQNVQLFVFSM